MKKVAVLLLALLSLASLAGCAGTGAPGTTAFSAAPHSEAPQSAPTSPEEAEPNPLALADNHIRITSQSGSATFQLYHTTAAEQLYAQLPLTLETTNFRNAQWMFYPPQTLDVAAQEAYHDGKRGELSYYEPWGDVFVLYEDFYAGDEMHRLGVCVDGVDNLAALSGIISIEKVEEVAAPMPNEPLQISVTAGAHTVVFELNGSAAAQQLYAQLPLEVDIENFSNNEKIFYPPDALDTAGTPAAQGGAGTLAYYAPWGDVVLFYGDFAPSGSLYALGHAVTGEESIAELAGTARVEQHVPTA